MTQLAFPYRIDGRGRTAEADEETHIRDLIEQVLFTAPGERVMRPDFGCGLLALAFEPNSPELAATTQLLVQGALQQWLGDLIRVDTVEMTSVEATLTVRVQYAIRRTNEHRSAQFSFGGGR
jgi:uncharacterized protein